MKNNIAIKLGANPQPFFDLITEYLGNNISSNLCQSLANLLSLDYANRLGGEPPLKIYIHTCLKRLTNHLGAQAILDNNFSETMTLFAVAITPEKESADNISNSQEQSQDALIEATISELFSNSSPEERKHIKLVIKDLLNSKDGEDLINMISSEPKVFQKIIINSIDAKIKTKETSKIVRQHIGSLCEHSKQIKNKSEVLRSVVGKLALSGSILIAASLGLVVGGLALPALIVPATIAAIKIAPAIGERIAYNVINNNTTIQNQIREFDKAKMSNLPIINKQTIEENIEKSTLPELSQEQVKYLAKTVSVNSIDDIQHVQDNKSTVKTQTLETGKNKPSRSI
jgi:hypothetical protein